MSVTQCCLTKDTYCQSLHTVWSPNKIMTRRQKHNTCQCDKGLRTARSSYIYARLFSAVPTGRQRIQQFPAPKDAQDPNPTKLKRHTSRKPANGAGKEADKEKTCKWSRQRSRQGEKIANGESKETGEQKNCKSRRQRNRQAEKLQMEKTKRQARRKTANGEGKETDK